MYGATAVTSNTNDQIFPPLKVYASNNCAQVRPCTRRPNTNSNTSVNTSQPMPIVTYLATVVCPNHGSATYVTSNMTTESKVPLKRNAKEWPSLGINTASRSVPFAMASTRITSHTTNALIAIFINTGFSYFV